MALATALSRAVFEGYFLCLVVLLLQKSVSRGSEGSWDFEVYEGVGIFE